MLSLIVFWKVARHTLNPTSQDPVLKWGEVGVDWSFKPVEGGLP